MITSSEQLKILIVDDEDKKLKEWEEAIESHNLDRDRHGFELEMISAKSVKSAISKIKTHRIDAVIIDLGLQVESGVSEINSDGNELVRYLSENQPVGVAVWTGSTGAADTAINAQVRIFDKGDGDAPVFNWLASNKDVFLQLRNVRELFDKETAKLFYQSIWPRWEQWHNNSNASVEALTKTITRHMVAHVHDSLLSSDEEYAHPEEAYFVPPLKDRLDTGDLIDFEKNVWIVVTPRCDLANPNKSKTVLLARCADKSDEWKEFASAPQPLSQKLKDKRHKLIQHENNALRQHFLSPMSESKSKERGPWLVQFDDLRAMPVAEAQANLLPLRFASLSPMFIPSLVERFGGYFSRIGTPNLSSD
jgi:CheY-like chemotaxis protein